ncbi:hypothetical protein EHS25_008417 [Saitozyma podzolica]|uniref:Uncharacterized protein n=1 Tax=Saitozyma podzolica TaxID=1890683 RepID=A0A427YPG9_9TREE|nr:hypothetical protein EHS25_008417 [Saitozyma podzolica]
MSFAGGLPYESTPPPEDPSTSGAGPGPAVAAMDQPLTDDPLDRPLDDYRPPVPDHGKVYLLEDSPAIIHVDAEAKIRGDPRIAALAEQLDEQDPTSWLEDVTRAAPSPVRSTALFVRSDLIKHLSTSKVFSWCTSLGASVMGIEWLNDTTLNLVFSTSADALLALSLLSKAGFDPSAGDDPLEERSAHSIPISLLPQAPLDPSESQAGAELLAPSSGASEENGIRRKGRGNFSSGAGSRAFGEMESERLAPVERENEWNLAEGVDPHARITIRFATEADKKFRAQAKESQWYAKHGRQAGKEIASSSREFTRRRANDEPISWEGRGSGEGSEFARRIGRERREQYPRRDDRDRNGNGNGKDLDLELERMARRRGAGAGEGEEGGAEGGMDVDMDMDVDREERRYGARDRRGGQRERRGKEDLDKELDDMFAARAPAA